MIRYMLDTDICTYIINKKPANVAARFRKEPFGTIGISSVSASELAFGVTKSGSTKNRQALELFLSPLTVLPFDESIIWTYGSVRTEVEKSGTPIGAMDLMIAAHALSLNACLITNNVNEFQRVNRLQVENWVN